MSLRRTAAIVRKELLHIVRDPRNLFLVTVSPAFLLFLLSYIFSFELNQANLAVLDLDRTPLSRQYLASLTDNGDLVLAYFVNSYQEIQPLLVGGEVDAGLVIPPGFADQVHGGEAAQVQAIVDGTDPFAASQATTSLIARSSAFVARGEASTSSSSQQPVQVLTQAWYNAGLQSLLGMVPGLLAIVLIMPALALALALTREKESGTLEGLMATPVAGLEYLTGKLLAYIGTGLVSAVLALLVAVLWFKVPFRGSLPVFLLLVADYSLACMGATVVVANLVKSQQTAMFIVLLVFIVPSFFLAGLITPVSTGSLVPRLTSYALPATHFVEISRILFLKGLSIGYVAQPALTLLGMGLVALLIGLWSFKKKVG
jgi:ABC-2 type transport system permease protein